MLGDERLLPRVGREQLLTGEYRRVTSRCIRVSYRGKPAEQLCGAEKSDVFKNFAANNRHPSRILYICIENAHDNS
jgi:hypothetical protein